MAIGSATDGFVDAVVAMAPSSPPNAPPLSALRFCDDVSLPPEGSVTPRTIDRTTATRRNAERATTFGFLFGSFLALAPSLALDDRPVAAWGSGFGFSMSPLLCSVIIFNVVLVMRYERFQFSLIYSFDIVGVASVCPSL